MYTSVFNVYFQRVNLYNLLRPFVLFLSVGNYSAKSRKKINNNSPSSIICNKPRLLQGILITNYIRKMSLLLCVYHMSARSNFVNIIELHFNSNMSTEIHYLQWNIALYSWHGDVRVKEKTTSEKFSVD